MSSTYLAKWLSTLRDQSPTRTSESVASSIASRSSNPSSRWKGAASTVSTGGPRLPQSAATSIPGSRIFNPPRSAIEEEELREATRQALFQRESNNFLELPQGYLRVAVLIIRWHESIDDFRGHTEEIQRLEKIFVAEYGYTCKVHSIQNLKKPQLDLNKAILDHIFEHDGPNNLLIFYYTGHGDQSVNDLELSANQEFASITSNHIPTAFWNSAEEPIRHHMEGDALSILDCCMASTAGMKCRNGLPRTYQLLAASAADAPTCGPGQNSFTTALCDSLQELIKEADGGTFLLTQLCERINTTRKSQACLSWDRLRSFKRTVQLGRIEPSHDPSDISWLPEPELSSLYLRLSFKTIDLEDDQITRLAEQIPRVCHETKVALRRIDWIRMISKEHDGIQTAIGYRKASLENGTRVDLDFYHAAKTVLAAQRVRNAFRKRRADRTCIREALLSPSVSYWVQCFMVLKILAFISTIGLMYVRGEQKALVLSGITMAWLLVYGPCKLLPSSTCVPVKKR